MASKQDVSISVIKRLPRYYRFLGDLLQRGVNRISSRELAQTMKLTASQIRQDLNCFGGFGQQGYGYNVEALHGEIGNILGLQNGLNAIIIGAGNLGTAIAKHMNFESRGFNVIGIFDANEKIIGTKIKGITVENVSNLDNFCLEQKPQVAILCIPKEAAKELADKLVALGIKGFWNFSHYDLALTYDNIAVENVHLGDSLMTLCYQVNKTIENP